MKKYIIFILLMRCIFQLNAQSDKFEDNYISKKELKIKYGKCYLDSIESYRSSNYNKEINYIFKLRNLKNLVIYDTYYSCQGDGKHSKCYEKKIGKRLLPIPKTVKYIEFNSSIPLPLPFDLSSQSQILEELHIQDSYFSQKTDSVCIDLSQFTRLQNFSFALYVLYQDQPIKCFIKMPPNLISFSGLLWDKHVTYDHFPITLQYLNITIDSLYPKQLFELKSLKSLSINNNDFTLTEDFLSLTSLKSIKLNRITIQDVNVLTKMTNLDTLIWDNKKSIYPRNDFLEIAKGIPVEIKNIKVKNIMVSGFGELGPEGGGWLYNLHIATIIKRRLPYAKVYYYVSHNQPMRAVTESDLKQKNFYDYKSLDE
jgi:hypothetical protein